MSIEVRNLSKMFGRHAALRDVSLGTVTVPSDRWDTVSDWYIATENVWKIFAKIFDTG